jgi:hypothetical protein
MIRNMATGNIPYDLHNVVPCLCDEQNAYSNTNRPARKGLMSPPPQISETIRNIFFFCFIKINKSLVSKCQ